MVAQIPHIFIKCSKCSRISTLAQFGTNGAAIASLGDKRKAADWSGRVNII